MQAERFDVAVDMICFGADDAASDIRAFTGVSHFIQVSTACTYGIDYDFLPVTEDHPLRPVSGYAKNKRLADATFLQAHYRDGFPVTIIKPSTTFGPQMGLLRQVAWEFSWLHRIETGRPILRLGEGNTPHQMMHVDDAARFFSLLVGRQDCVGQTYNMVSGGYVTWNDWHRTAMKVIGTDVEMIGVTLAQLEAADVPSHGICRDVFAHNCYYSNVKQARDIPHFVSRLDLEAGMRDVYQAMKEADRIPESPVGGWEDQLLERLAAL